MRRRFVVTAFGIALLLSSLAQAQEPTQQPPASPPQAGRAGPEAEKVRGLLGKITATHKDSLELARPDGSTVTIRLTDQTQFRKERQPAKLSDFKEGDIVFVRGEENADGSWTAQMVGTRGMGASGGPGGPGGMRGTLGKDFVAGEIKEINAPKLTVLRPDNVTQTIELNEETSLRKGQESVTLADVQVGDHIFARGAVVNDVFVPKMVVVATAEQWQWMQQMGGFGQAPKPPQNPRADTPKPPELRR